MSACLKWSPKWPIKANSLNNWMRRSMSFRRGPPQHLLPSSSQTRASSMALRYVSLYEVWQLWARLPTHQPIIFLPFSTTLNPCLKSPPRFSRSRTASPSWRTSLPTNLGPVPSGSMLKTLSCGITLKMPPAISPPRTRTSFSRSVLTSMTIGPTIRSPPISTLPIQMTLTAINGPNTSKLGVWPTNTTAGWQDICIPPVETKGTR